MGAFPDHLVMLDCHGATDVGCVREHNEDRILIASACRWMIVADGMGGYEGGEVAARLAVDIAHQSLKKAYMEGWSVEQARLALNASIRDANSAVVEMARARMDLANMGSTLLIATLCGDQLICAHVGDSRLYACQNGQVRRLTRDHTVMDACIEAGVVNEQEAKLLGFRGSLTRGLGGRENVLADIGQHGVSRGMRILACTDGLTDMLDDADIADLLQRYPANADVVDQLVSEAKKAGGRDNVSVIVATVA